MKTYFFLSAFLFLFESHTAFSAVSTYGELTSPSVNFSREASSQLFGGGKKGILNCAVLLNKDWAYPNGQVAAFCNEAETACIRYGLIYQTMKISKGAVEDLKQDFSVARRDVELKLRGCQLAIEATISNSQSVGAAAGFTY